MEMHAMKGPSTEASFIHGDLGVILTGQLTPRRRRVSHLLFRPLLMYDIRMRRTRNSTAAHHRGRFAPGTEERNEVGGVATRDIWSRGEEAEEDESQAERSDSSRSVINPIPSFDLENANKCACVEKKPKGCRVKSRRHQKQD